MLHRIKKHTVSFKHALDGIIYTVTSQPNFQFHLMATIIAFIFGLYFKIDHTEWLILFFTVNLVLASEMINTAIESMVDLITTERREQAKVAKDVAAGMVLVSAIMAVSVGLIIFLPKIISLFK